MYELIVANYIRTNADELKIYIGKLKAKKLKILIVSIKHANRSNIFQTV